MRTGTTFKIASAATGRASDQAGARPLMLGFLGRRLARPSILSDRDPWSLPNVTSYRRSSGAGDTGLLFNIVRKWVALVDVGLDELDAAHRGWYW